MHDSPPPYPGINPSYQPSYPTQPNGPAPQMGFAGAPPSYGGGSSFPQAPGPSYPNLPPNGFNAGFQQAGASAPTSGYFESIRKLV